MANRKGRQTPTQSHILPYRRSLGTKAAALYNTSGRKAQEWQKRMLKDIMACTQGKGLWVHTKFGFSVPRRNGKNEVLLIREMYGLAELGEHILHTAHRTTTTHAAWERLYDRLEKLEGIEIVSSYRAYGKEHIELSNGGKIEFRTRTSKGGLGEGFDLLVIDEAQEYQDDQESALKYVVTDSKNPQTIFIGTPPTPVSSGTVFTKFRTDVLAGTKENAGWAEWSVEHETDPHDREAWYRTNPSLGTVFQERAVADEIGSDKVDFNIQRLGLWIRYNQKSAITPDEWRQLREMVLPELQGGMFVGVKYGHDGEYVSLSIAIKTTDARIFVESIDCRPVRAGNGWIIDFIRAAGPAVRKVVVDGANGQSLLATEMKDAKIKSPELPSVKQIIVANASFEQGLYSGRICHMGQPALEQAATNSEKRAIGSNGGFGYRSIKEGVEISLLDSVILAYAAANEARDVPVKQRISY